MAKHIGIVAGSAEGAALCYRTICLEAQELLGGHNRLEVTMNSIREPTDDCSRFAGVREMNLTTWERFT